MSSNRDSSPQNGHGKNSIQDEVMKIIQRVSKTFEVIYYNLIIYYQKLFEYKFKSMIFTSYFNPN